MFTSKQGHFFPGVKGGAEQKSALAIQIAVDAAMNQGKQIMYVSLEMGKRQIFGRAVANLAKVNSETVMYDSNLVNSPKYAAPASVGAR